MCPAISSEPVGTDDGKWTSMDSALSRIFATATGVLVLASLSGCGGGNDFAELPAADIQKAAVKDMEALDSVSMEGTLKQGDQELGLDLSLNSKGDCKGTLSLDEGSADFISTGGSSYLKGDDQFWVGTTGGEDKAKAITSVLGDKWALFPSDGGGFGGLCDLDELLSGIADGDVDLKKGKVSEVNGDGAVELTSKEDGATTTALVATGDDHYILKISKDGDEPGSFTFSDFNKALDVAAPADDDVVDLATSAG